jgi:N-acetylglucosaminyldiphosphoundecaprenol N-acetyl-beta-D-mannosaminyltransferase
VPHKNFQALKLTCKWLCAISVRQLQAIKHKLDVLFGDMMAIVQEAPITASERISHKPLREEHASESFTIFGISIASTTMDRAIRTVASWAQDPSTTKIAAFSTVHMLTEAHSNPGFYRILQETNLNFPDGMPLVWLGRLKGRAVGRVAGPDFMPAFCAATASKGFRHFFYGGRPGIAKQVAENLKRANPDLQVVGWHTPPVMDLNGEEDSEGIRAINDSAADIVWICLGCPKQEKWMWQHRTRFKAGALLSVGQAFDIVAGATKRAPRLFRSSGLEWLYRLVVEPRRLIGRYIPSNVTFLRLLLHNALASKRVNTGRTGFTHGITER